MICIIVIICIIMRCIYISVGEVNAFLLKSNILVIWEHMLWKGRGESRSGGSETHSPLYIYTSLSLFLPPPKYITHF